jgi:hypothetical protein
MFFIFRSSKIRISPTGVFSSLSPPQCRLSSDRCSHAATSCHTSFSLRHDELAVSASSSANALSRCLPSRAKTKALNPQHHRKLLSPYHPTHILHCYKKIISTLATLPTIQQRLHFTSSLARASRYQSSTSHRHFLSLLSHTHRPSAQRHPW